MEWVKVLIILAVGLIGFEAFDQCMYAFDHPFFAGEAYLSILVFFLVLVLIPKTVYTVLKYKPKPKEGPKP